MINVEVWVASYRVLRVASPTPLRVGGAGFGNHNASLILYNLKKLSTQILF